MRARRRRSTNEKDRPGLAPAGGSRHEGWVFVSYARLDKILTRTSITSLNSCPLTQEPRLWPGLSTIFNNLLSSFTRRTAIGGATGRQPLASCRVVRQELKC